MRMPGRMKSCQNRKTVTGAPLEVGANTLMPVVCVSHFGVAPPGETAGAVVVGVTLDPVGVIVKARGRRARMVRIRDVGRIVSLVTVAAAVVELLACLAVLAKIRRRDVR